LFVTFSSFDQRKLLHAKSYTTTEPLNEILGLYVIFTMAATKDVSPKSLQLDRYQGLTPSSTTHDKLFQRTELMLLQPNWLQCFG
jgi:hypothetical protein